MENKKVQLYPIQQFLIQATRDYMMHARIFMMNEIACIDTCLYILYCVKEDIDILHQITINNRFIRFKAFSNGLFEGMEYINPTKDFQKFLSQCLMLEKSIRKMDRDEYIKAYPFILRYLLDPAHVFSHRLFGIDPTQSLVDLFSKIIKNYGTKSVYNPFAGAGLLSFGLGEDVKYLGQEPNSFAYKYALLLKDAQSNDIVQIVQEYPFENWCDKEKDTIISMVPWGPMRDATPRIFVEEKFLGKASTQAKVSIGIYPMTILSRPISKHSRAVIIGEGNIDTIIYLPGNLLSETPVPSCMIITNRNHEHKGSIKYIDATQLFTRSEKRQVYLDVDKIFHLYISTEVSENVQYVTYEQIAANEYDLSWERYCVQNINIPDGYRLVELRNILTKLELQKPGCNSSAPMVRISDLSRNQLDVSLNIDRLEVERCRKDCKLVNRDALLVSFITKLKPTLFKYSGVDIFVTSNILAFEVNTKIASYNYIVNELYQDYVQKQLSFRGSAQQYIDLESFLSAKVLISDELGKQDEKAAKELLQLAQDQEQKTENKLDEYKQRYIKELRMRKHAIGQVLQDIVIAFEDLDDLRTYNEGKLSDSDLVSKVDGSTVADYFAKIKIACDRVNGMIDKLTDEPSFGQPEKFNLGDFLEDYKSTHLQHGYNLDVIRDLATITEYAKNPETGEPDENSVAFQDKEACDEYMVNISKKDLSQVLDNILTNARKYAFPKDKVNNIVKMEMWIDQLKGTPAVVLSIVNNGEPLPPNISKEEIFEWGKSSADGKGIGGWQIRNIIEHFNGQVEFVEFDNLEESDGFTLGYKIKLPLIEEL